jgi:four helix bundle protein
MEKTRDFTDLIAWQKAHEFALRTYSLTSRFPKDELFGISFQIRKAAVSIAANIAEGYTKTGLRDKMRFFNIAQGSLSECKYYLILVRDLKYSSIDEMVSLLAEVSKLLNSYKRGIERNSNGSLT